MAKKKKSSRVVGDTPLSWLREGDNGGRAHGNPVKSGRQNRKRQAAVGAETPAQYPSGPDPAAVGTPADRGTEAAERNAPIILDAILTIAEAAALKGQLLPHVNRQGEISIDGSRVESVDTAALQVLLAFMRSARTQGAVIRWTGISEALLNTAQLLGVARLISLQD